jgi:hypothetical protein
VVWGRSEFFSGTLPRPPQTSNRNPEILAMSCLPSLATVLSFLGATLRLRSARHLLPLLALGLALPALQAET